ncbi:conserved hypothetical protein [Alteracholeplasma palmae J233]|uniref:Uncharacterized protein n=1 Tax=Alteracholeplasma palmae (strain ATCC 49389 / J233) TaxID=1318466 RepID=U4KPF2_ALTPJ|nr:hypothetical protein [Alteracholeplasma palmae]CCV64115.1 conserved hypothetical protein [Alteracholeplasma palmae J233]
MRKIYFSFIAVLAVCLTLTVSAFAWLNISNITLVEGIYLKAGSGDLLELSLDGITYNKTLDQNRIKNSLKNLKIKPISTNDGKTFYTNPYQKNDAQARKNIDYMSFEIWFRITPEENISDESVYKDIYLVNHQQVTYEQKENAKGTFITSKGKQFKSDIDFKLSEETEIKKTKVNTYYAKDAMRIGVVSNDETKFILDPSGVEKNNYAYGALDYYNKKMQTHLIPPVNHIETITELSVLSKNKANTIEDNKSHITTLEKKDNSYIGRATINIWLEGWDPYALDAIIKDNVYIQLEFIAVIKEN